MKRSAWHGLVFSFAAFISAGSPLVWVGGAEAQDSEVTAFVNVTVVPMDRERTLPNHTVLVSNGRIVEVGHTEAVEVPAGARVIDGSGKFLMPGLAEMHGHTPVPQGNVNSPFVENMMFLYAANGVTTVRGMLGQPAQLELKALTNSGTMVGPTLYLAGPSFNGNSINSAAQAAERVRQQHAEGWDLLKVHPGLTREEYDSLANAAAEVGIRFGGHVPADVGIMNALKAGQETFDHLDGYLQHLDAFDSPIDVPEMDRLIELTISAGAWVVPTMVLWDAAIIGIGSVEEMQRYPEMRFWPPTTSPGAEGVDGWTRRMQNSSTAFQQNPERAMQWRRNRMQLLKALSDAGAGILMGTDSPQLFSVPGFSLHREMQTMADAGMTPYQILESGTKNVGIYFQSQDSFGTIAIGRRADLILTNSNPLEDIANVADRAGVMVRGRWLSEEMIQGRLEEIAAGYGN